MTDAVAFCTASAQTVVSKHTFPLESRPWAPRTDGRVQPIGRILDEPASTLFKLGSRHALKEQQRQGQGLGDCLEK